MATLKQTDIWFFVGHSIGVTLLGIHTLEAGFFSLPGEQRGKLFLVVNGDKTQLYQDILNQYPHITLVTISRRSAGTLMKIVLNRFGRKQLVLHPLSFGSVHFIHALLTRIIICAHLSSRSIVFGMPSLFNRFWFTDVLTPKLDQSIFTSMEQAVATSGISVHTRTPHLLYAVTPPAPILISTKQPYIVIHPFAANAIRSLPRERWLAILNFLYIHYPQYQIIISGSPNDRVEAMILIEQSKGIKYFSEDLFSSFLPKVGMIAKASLYIGVDTGPTHVAAHVGVPTIVIGNNSNPCWLPTYNNDVTILMNLKNCTCTLSKGGDCKETYNGNVYYRCMLQIPQLEIEQAVNKKLQ